MWMGSNVSAEGITKDLEAMKAAGIGGATIMSLADSCIPWAGFIGQSPTPEVVAFSQPWWQLVRHAASEAHRLGLELILHNCPGYESSGGPWITPDLSMQEVVWSETRVHGGAVYSGQLPRPKVDPHPHAQFPKVYIPELGRVGIPVVEARQTYFNDIAVLAIPAEGNVAQSAILSLSNHVTGDGLLEWDAPSGEWTVYRFGHTTTGAMIQPAQWNAMGLECDKMNKDAVTFHVQHVLGEMKKNLGDLMGKGITTLYFDSYEAGVPNWTPKMREEFLARRGYDITPWLPALAGRTINNDVDTKRFRSDLKRTVFDLYRDEYWATIGPLANRAGLKFAAEPYEGPWVIGEVVKSVEVPTVEFWTHGNKYSPSDLVPVVTAAHASGAALICAESFTTDPKEAHWDEHPAWLKPIGDAAFCDGVQRMNLHHWVQQPWDDRYKPGNTMGQWGVHFGRNQTWWEPGKAWLAYLSRCQNLLQRGTFVAPAQGNQVILSDVRGTSGADLPKPEFRSIHRQIGNASVFFVANTGRVGAQVHIQLPVSGMQPEQWDPVWGSMRDLPQFSSSNGTTHLELEFAAAQSFFLVFRKPQQGDGRGSNLARYQTISTVEGSWEVAFSPAWGGPSSITFPALIDWTSHELPGIRYYSGTAEYTKTFQFNPVGKGAKVLLDLGVCHHLAAITCNGRALGVLWTAPWRIDLSDVIKPGENKLQIKITNVWANRLIGDEQQPPDWEWEDGDPDIKSGQFMKAFPEWFLEGKARPSSQRYTFTTWNYFTPKSPLVASGLLGPVRIVTEA
jgi:hypothetical protein